jgi:DNA-binding NtrC family response regulator
MAGESALSLTFPRKARSLHDSGALLGVLGGAAVANILVTDDDKACRESMQKVLEQQGYMVRATADVDSALHELSARHFDLVVCDYRMPGKTGIDLLVEMKHCRFSVPVLIVSASADVQTQAATLEHGAIGFLKKPVRRQDLLDQAAKAIHR